MVGVWARVGKLVGGRGGIKRGVLCASSATS